MIYTTILMEDYLNSNKKRKVTILGKALSSTIATMDSLGPIGQEVLKKFGILSINESRSYPIEIRNAIHKAVLDKYGSIALVDIGFKKKDNILEIGKNDDWLEVLGCGMVNVEVIENCGIDSNIYKGFAFGLGVERFAMLKYGINDLRMFYENDMRWLKHFSFKPKGFPSIIRGLK